MAPSAYAEEGAELQVSTNLAMVSKYIWRGLNLNDELSAQGSFDLAYKGFYAGTWGGTDEASGTEIDIYVGYTGQLTETISFDIGAVQYRYPSTGDHVKEWHTTVDFDYASVSYHKGENHYSYWEVNSSIELTEQLSVGVHYGLEDSGDTDLNDYQLSLNYQINDTYSTFIAAGDKERGDSHIFAGLKAAF